VIDSASAHIVVRTHRQWFGDPRLGTFVVYLDNERAGVLPPEGRLDLQCDPGDHVVRIRQWWYRSHPIRLCLLPAQSLNLNADIVRTGGLLIRMATLILTPGRALTLDEISSDQV